MVGGPEDHRFSIVHLYLLGVLEVFSDFISNSLQHMHNLHGGTVIGYATTMMVHAVAAIISREFGITILTLLFLSIMLFSTLFAVGTIVRFLRNYKRYQIDGAVQEARKEWFTALSATQTSINVTQ